MNIQGDGDEVMECSIFEELWTGSFSEDLLEMKKFWDSRAEDFNENVMKEERQAEKMDLVEFLVSKGALNEGLDILDIGCGPGRYSMEFARIAKSVAAVDISPEMLRHAEENVKARGLDNVSFRLAPWQNLNMKELGWNKRFDLVFASMSPAINSKEALMKMMEASRKYCFMSGFACRNNEVENELMKKIVEQENKKKCGNSVYCAFNILWNMGFYPEIICKDVVWEKVIPVEKAAELHASQLSKAGCDDKHLKEKVERHLESMSKNGNVKEVTEAKIAWMFWEAC